MKAFKLINTPGNLCRFIEGRVPELAQVGAKYFFVQTHIADYEKHPHPAPRYQYVVTLKGRLRFTVSDGTSFIIEPGVLLIADDLAGEGHTWELLEGPWERLYIAMNDNEPDHFLPDEAC